MTWFKVRADDYYPRVVRIHELKYGRDDPSNPRRLPRGEPFGVPNRYWPRLGRRVQLLAEARGANASRFRDTLRGYGFDWRGLEADHVLDLQWGGPDEFENLWPMDSSANKSAGPRQNSSQRVAFCETKAGPRRSGVSLVQLKRERRHFGRWFVIARVER
jgi:hypothetical protein